jgi:hypothetical protein
VRWRRAFLLGPLMAAATGCGLLLGLEDHELVASQQEEASPGVFDVEGGATDATVDMPSPPPAPPCGPVEYCESFDLGNGALSASTVLVQPFGATPMFDPVSTDGPHSLRLRLVSGAAKILARPLLPPGPFTVTDYGCVLDYHLVARGAPADSIIVFALSLPSQTGGAYRMELREQFGEAGAPLFGVRLTSPDGGIVENMKASANRWVHISAQLSFVDGSISVRADNDNLLSTTGLPLEGDLRVIETSYGVIADESLGGPWEARFDAISCRPSRY